MARARNDVVLYGDQVGKSGRVALENLGIPDDKIDRIYAAFPRLQGLEEASEAALRRLGLTRAQARRVRSAFQVVQACDAACAVEAYGQTIKRATDVVPLLKAAIARRPQEWFVVVALDRQNRVMDVMGVAIGSLAQVDVHPRELFRKPLARGAKRIIIAHNHPSGTADPSPADVDLTNRMAEVGELLGIPLVDSFVITPYDSTSLAGAGLIKGAPLRKRNDVLLREREDPRGYLIESLRELGVSKKRAEALVRATPDLRHFRAGPAWLQAKGLTPQEAERVHAAFSLREACDEQCRRWRPTLRKPYDAVTHAYEVLGAGDKEWFVAIFLDARQAILTTLGAMLGDKADLVVRPGDVMKAAVKNGAKAVLLAHYRPGVAKDDLVTGQAVTMLAEIQEAGALVGIPVLDMVLLNDSGGYQSLAALGLTRQNNPPPGPPRRLRASLL